jgi:hypothetical protein
MKRAGLVGLLAVVIAGAIWIARGGDDRPRSTVHYRDRRTALAPRRAPVHDIDAVAASADGVLRLDGRVIGPDGQAVGGATVVLEPTPSRTATAAADGGFSFSRLDRQGYSLFVSAGDLVGGPIRVAVTDSPRPLVIRLARGGFQTVTVVDGAGRPILGARVDARVGGWASTISTDAAGRVKLGPLPPGFAAIAVDAPGYAPDADTVVIAAAMEVGATTIVLHRGTPVSGRVVDENHQPIAGARITVIGARGGGLNTTPILGNDRGDFAIPQLVRGTYVLQAADDEHAVTRSAPVAVDGSPIDGVEIVMKDAGVISGIVLDRSRRPAPFAGISAVGAAGGTLEVTADQNGAFELRGLARYFLVLRAETATATSSAVQLNLSEKPEAEVELVLESVGTIEGTVVDERGSPLAGITVTASPDWAHLPPSARPAGLREAITDDDGRFILHGLPELPYLLDAKRRGASFASPSPRRAPARVGAHDVQIRLVPDGQIVGRIALDGLDTAPSNVILKLWNGPPTPANRDGSFQIQDVPPGDHYLWFESPDFTAFYKPGIEVHSGATTDLGTLTAPRSRTLVGRVVDGSGAPIGGAQVEVGVIRPPPIEVDDPAAGFHAYRSAVAAPDGTFRVSHVPSAPMIAIASAPSYASSEGTAILGGPGAPGDPPPVTLVLSGVRDRR